MRPARGSKRSHNAETPDPPSPPSSPSKRQRVETSPFSAVAQEGDALTEDDLVSGDDGHDDSKKPIFWLTDFEFHDPQSMRFATPDELSSDSRVHVSDLVGSAMASPLVLDSEWDDESGAGDDGEDRQSRTYVPLQLGSVFRSSIDLGTEYIGDSPWQLDRDHIWVETFHAFYLLLVPRHDYRKIYAKFYKPRRMSQIVVQSALHSHRLDISAFAKHLSRYAKDSILDRRWTLKDFDSSKSDVAKSLLEELDDERHAHLFDTLAVSPLVRHFLPKWAPCRAAPAQDNAADDEALQFVTPIVYRHARPYFRSPLTVIDPATTRRSPSAGEESDIEDLVPLALSESRPTSPTASDIQQLEVELDCACDDTDEGHFLEATVNGCVYRAHDVVKVYGAKRREWWFGRVAYFIKDSSRKTPTERFSAHIEWFDRASAILGPLGCPTELFALLSCGNISVFEIRGPPIILTQPSYPLATEPQGLFCTYLYSSASFVHLARYPGRCTPGTCFVCGVHAQRELDARTDEPSLGASSRRILGVVYHLHDFVFLRRRLPKDTRNLLDGGTSRIAQIVRFAPSGKVHLFMFVRGESGPEDPFAERMVVPTAKTKVVASDELVSRCNVRAVRPSDDELVHNPWLFFVADERENFPENFSMCKICHSDDRNRVELSDAFDAACMRDPLLVLDPYCGAGGLTLGLERGLGSGCTMTQYAIDIDRSAANTFQSNNPDATVFHTDANDFLVSRVKNHPLTTLTGEPRYLGARIDLICAGVPCQGHSGLNLFRKAEHRNNNQLLTALSLVEVYRPRYFCLENVPAIANWRLQHNRLFTEGGIPHGGLRLAISILLALGYQIRVGLLQAGHYGTPQGRRRFFLLAADRNSSLPDFPHPTASFAASRHLRLAAFSDLTVPWPEVADDSEDDTHLPSCIPHSLVTVQSAIDDLHGFDWRPATEHAKTSDPPSFPCLASEGCIPSFSTAYASLPQNTYQACARLSQDSPSFHDLQHVTTGCPPDIVQNVARMNQSTDYRGIGPARRQDFMTGDPTSATGRKGFASGIYYQRLESDGIFSTLVTNVYPTATQSQVIHPKQNRLISIREMARGQGFPDSYRFDGSIRDMQRQIVDVGNAVPVPLGEAIGREIRAAMLKDFVEQGRAH
ncbi:S-adenosyl-L-methionine-dependent methyltransferase [Exidia glandulosa HHB12029]|uniref:DNA (cytosine-5-)-methyltransferase n=1 Tax=Exidia glandulosa HHB12029 TaxID=1314781 RepID=A0A165IYV0_EXIGL|nr:S-adenosyl-L-methionine-dependent methyltransferase [Exidia glandulosa HHB12029]